MRPRPTLTLTEAVERCDQSRSTLQRWIKAGKVEGAVRETPGDDRSPWKIPIEGLLQAGAVLDAPETNPSNNVDLTEEPESAPEVESLRIEMAEYRRRAEVAEAIAAERLEALKDARLALRALGSGEPVPAEQPKAPPAPVSSTTAPEGRFKRALKQFRG